jgi:hypothetical protein
MHLEPRRSTTVGIVAAVRQIRAKPQRRQSRQPQQNTLTPLSRLSPFLIRPAKQLPVAAHCTKSSPIKKALCVTFFRKAFEK